ncbi:MAG TPA: hypothetical protein VFP26_03690 [Gemmatimonadaceae bacterium]|jgi:hypothetical protein|nr:hypothetical protein [Gemmatimonadaceae bacterium]
MARAYTVATAALALHVSTKWLDNTLSHCSVQGVSQTRQGVSRKLSIESLTILAIAIALMSDLHTPLTNAIEFATQLTQSGGRIALRDGITIELDIQRATTGLLERLEHAVEIAPLPRRGRPPQKTTGRLD